MSDFITDVEQQYEVYCKIAEEHGFIDLNAKKNGFRCTTKSSEFNAGWIAFTGAVAAVRDEKQSKVDELQKKNAWLTGVACRENKRANKLQEEKVSTTTLLGKTIQGKNELQKRLDAAIYLLPSIKAENDLWGCDQVEHQIELLEQALKGGSDE